MFGYAVAGMFLDVAYFSLFYAFVALAVIMRRELEEAPSPAVSTSVPERGTKGLKAGPRFPDFVATSVGPPAEQSAKK